MFAWPQTELSLISQIVLLLTWLFAPLTLILSDRSLTATAQMLLPLTYVARNAAYWSRMVGAGGICCTECSILRRNEPKSANSSEYPAFHAGYCSLLSSNASICCNRCNVGGGRNVSQLVVNPIHELKRFIMLHDEQHRREARKRRYRGK